MAYDVYTRRGFKRTGTVEQSVGLATKSRLLCNITSQIVLVLSSWVYKEMTIPIAMIISKLDNMEKVSNMYGIEQVIQKEKEKEGGVKTDHTIGIHTHMPKDTHTNERMIRVTCRTCEKEICYRQ